MLEKAKKSVLANILFIVLAFLVGYGAFNMVKQAIVFRKEAKNAERKVEELTRKKAELEAYLAELQTPEAIEREAKERLNLKKKGEEVVVVIPKDKKEDVSAVPSTFWQKIKSFFAGVLNYR